MADLKIMDRFKTNYEIPARHFLMKRTPVIIRSDGSAFHSLTKKIHAEKPFDMRVNLAMQEATIALCKKFSAIFGYFQSDEISILLLDDKTFETQAIFDNEINKLVSLSASTASVAFNKVIDCEAIFDSRAFNVPNNEVINAFIARQIDAARNAKNIWSECILGQKVGMGTARKMLHGLKAGERVELTEKETGSVFDQVRNIYRVGGEVIKYETEDGRKEWRLNEETPWYISDRQHIVGMIQNYYGEGVDVSSYG